MLGGSEGIYAGYGALILVQGFGSEEQTVEFVFRRDLVFGDLLGWEVLVSVGRIEGDLGGVRLLVVVVWGVEQAVALGFVGRFRC